jgi:prepilin-type processing-associated H-X9-DG protein
MDDVVEPANVVLLFESDAEDRNKSGAQQDLAPPLKRHLGMTNVALTDGHMQRYRPTRERSIHWDPKAASVSDVPAPPKATDLR